MYALSVLWEPLMTLSRPVEELRNVDDCVEEIIVRFSDAFALASIGVNENNLYDKILEVVLRAREVPLPVDAPGSQLQTWHRPEPPAQPPSQRRPH